MTAFLPAVCDKINKGNFILKSEKMYFKTETQFAKIIIFNRLYWQISLKTSGKK